MIKKNIFILSTLAVILIVATSGTKKIDHAAGVTGSYGGCSCHGATLGTVTLNNLATTVAPNTVNKFDLTYNQPGMASLYWGLDVKVFSGKLIAGPGMTSTGLEVTHNGSPLTSAATASYNYAGMSWDNTGLAPGTVVTIYYSVLGSPTMTAKDGRWAKKSFQVTIGALPVEFTSFNAVWEGQNKVNLNWETATETNTNYFEVQRSIDGVNYATVNKVNAAGNSKNMQSYSVNDIAPAAATTLYYRIKEVDINGAITYSAISAVKVNPAKDYVKTVFPNPVTGNQPVHIKYIATEAAQIKIDLYNYLGKAVNSVTVDAVKGENDFAMKPGHFISAGLYYLSVSKPNEKVAELPLYIQ